MYSVPYVGRSKQNTDLLLVFTNWLMERKPTIALIFKKDHRFLQVKDHAAQGGMINEAASNFPVFMERLFGDSQFSRRFSGSEEILNGLFVKDLA